MNAEARIVERPEPSESGKRRACIPVPVFAIANVCFPPIADMESGCDCAPMSTNQEFKCCYCDKEIEPNDGAALRITVTGLWSSADGAVQHLFAHSDCAADKLAGNFSQWVPFDVERFAPE